jgi:hypothetical protein
MIIHRCKMTTILIEQVAKRLSYSKSIICCIEASVLRSAASKAARIVSGPPTLAVFRINVIGSLAQICCW